MKIIAITGGVASGKNIVCEIFKKNGAKIFDADEVVHRILENDQQIIAKILKIFPEAKIDNFNAISRLKLGEIVFNSDEKLKILENIIHPIVKKEYDKFLTNETQNNSKILILNIPLILEKNNYSYDYLIAIKCSYKLRKKRFILRFKNKFRSNEKMLKYKNEEIADRFQKIANKQISDEARIAKANFIIDNNHEIIDLERQINEIIIKL